MGFLRNIAKKAGARAAKNEMIALQGQVQGFPESSVSDIFQASANMRHALTENLPHPYNAFFSVALTSTQKDLQDKEQLRHGMALLLPVLTELQRDSEDVVTKWAINFWRINLMVMINDELYEHGVTLWKIIKDREGSEGSEGGLLFEKRPMYYPVASL